MATTINPSERPMTLADLSIAARASGPDAMTADGGPLSPQAIQQMVRGMMASLDQEPLWPTGTGDTEGTTGTTGTTGTEGVGGLTALDGTDLPRTLVRDVTGTTPTLGGVSPPQVKLGPGEQVGAQSFVSSLDQALEDCFVKGHDADGNPIYKSPAEISSDDLLAAFMKLQITDPNNNVEVQDKLLQISKDLRQGALEKQRADLQNQAEKLKEAEAKQGSAKTVSIIASVVMVALAVVLAVVTFGAGAGLIALAVIAAGALIGMAASGGKMEGALMGMQIAAAIVCMVCTFGAGTAVFSGAMAAGQGAISATTMSYIAAGVGLTVGVSQAVANKQAADKQAEVDLAGLAAKEAEKRAQEQQKDVEQRNELIRIIMESKGAVIDAVLKMMANAQATNMKLATISASR